MFFFCGVVKWMMITLLFYFNFYKTMFVFGCLGRNELMLGNTFAAKPNSKPPNKEVHPKVGLYIFFQSIFLCFVKHLKHKRSSYK